MTNEVKISIKIDDNGNLSVIAKEAKVAAAGVDKLTESTKKNSKAGKNNHKALKGVAGATNNQTKAFSKLKDTLGSGSSGVVGAYAVLAANVFALTAAFGALSRAKGIQQLEEGLKFVGREGGNNLGIIANKLREVTGEAISASDAMRSVALGTSAGFAEEQLTGLARVAAGAAKALGRDMTDALDRLTRGAAKLEPEILDELGIMVRLDETTKKYADSVGKTVEQVTAFEKRMAFTNAIIEQGEKKFGALNAAVGDNQYSQLAATFDDLTKVIFNFTSALASPVISLFSNNMGLLFGVMVLFGSKISKQLLPSMESVQKSIEATGDASSKAALDHQKHFMSMKNLSPANAKLVKDNKGQILTQKQLNAAMLTSRKSIQSNTLWVGNFSKEVKLSAKDLLTQKLTLKTAIPIINEYGRSLGTAAKKLKNKIKDTIEAQRTGAQLTLSVAANTGALVRNSQAKATQTILDGQIIAGLKQYWASISITTEAYKNNTKNAHKNSRAIGLLRLRFIQAAAGAKLLGTALLQAIPIIGQLIFVASLAWPIIKKIFGIKDNPLKKALDENAERFEEFPNIAAQYAEGMEAATNSSDKFYRSIQAVSGIIGQTSSGFKALKTAEMVKDLKAVSEAERGLDSARDRTRGTQGLSARSNVRAKTSNLTKAKTNAATDSPELLEGNVEAATENSAVLQQMKSSTVEGTIAYVALTRAIEINKAIMKSGGIATDNQRTELDSLSTSLKETKDLMKSASDAQKAFSNEITRLGKKQATPYDKLNEALLKNQSILEKARGKDLDAGTGKNQAEIEAARKLFNKPVGPKDKEGKSTGVSDAAIVALIKEDKALLKIVESNVKIISEKKAALALDKQALKVLKNLAKNSVGAYEEQLALQESMLIKASERVEAEILVQKELEKQGNESKTLSSLMLQRKTIAADLALTENDNVRVTIKQNQEAVKLIQKKQQLLNLVNKINSAGTSTLDSVMTQQRAELELKRIQDAKNYKIGSSSAGAEKDEHSVLVGAEKKRQELAAQGLKNKLASINLEFTLLKLQTELQNSRQRLVTSELQTLKAKQEEKGGTASESLVKDIARSQEVESLGTQSVGLIESGQTAAVVQAEQEYSTGETVAQLNIAKASEEKTQASVSSANTGDTTLDRISNLDDSGGLEDKSMAQQFEAGAGALSPMMEQLAEIGPEGELMAAAIEGAAILGNTLFQAFEGGKLGAIETAQVAMEVAGTVVSTLANMSASRSKASIAAVDREIAAEKKKDGKSKESLAKLAQLDKKKEAMKKKAFNANKKAMMAQAAISTAAGVVGALSMSPWTPANFVLAAVVGALGIAQMSAISSTSYEGGGGGGASAGGMPSEVSVGKKSNSVDLATSKGATGELGYMRGGDGTGNANSFKPAFTGARYRASGGSTGYVVGEQGPELFIPEVSGEIAPAGDVDQSTSNTNVNFSIQAVDASGVEEMLEVQKENIIRMIRQAANDQGQSFLEEVNVGH